MTATVQPRTAAPAEIVYLALEDCQPHPANRKRFDQVALDELANSLRTSGQITPAIVRSYITPDQETRYELLAGERRWRAAKIAGLPTLMAIVRDLSDNEALEIVAIENGQREDLDPIDEAELFRAMLTLKGYNVPKIAERLKHSETYVRERLRLLRLTKEAQKLVIDGTIPVQHAALLATLSPADQARALKATHPVGGLFRTERTLFDDGACDSRVPVSLAEFRDWIRSEVRLNARADVLAEIFPETLAAVKEADATRQKVLSLTTDYRVADAAKDASERTIGHAHWKRADGAKGSKTCVYAELGVVVTGEAQGQAFTVCIRKDKCATHWPQEVKAAAQRAKEKAVEAGKAADANPSEVEKIRKKQEAAKAKQEATEAEVERWAKAQSALRKALIAAVRKLSATPDGKLGKLLLERCWGADELRKEFKPTTAAEIIQFLALWDIFENEYPAYISSEWDVNRAKEILKGYGVNAQKIVDEAAPTSSPTKRLAGDVRREKAAKKKAGAK